MTVNQRVAVEATFQNGQAGEMIIKFYRPNY